MALQANGITIVEVNNALRKLIIFVGAVDIRLSFDRRADRFVETSRTFIDGRRVTGRIRIPDSQYRAMMRQAHAIARDHGWRA